MNRDHLDSSEKTRLAIGGIIFFAIVGVVIFFDIKSLFDLLEAEIEIPVGTLMTVFGNIVFKIVTSIGAFMYLLERKVKKIIEKNL